LKKEAVHGDLPIFMIFHHDWLSQQDAEYVFCEVGIVAEETIIYNMRYTLSAEVQALNVTDFKSRMTTYQVCQLCTC
jgi:hypothetical protein